MNLMRIDFMKRLYKEARDYNTMDVEMQIWQEELVEDCFDIQYLESAGYTSLFERNGELYANITAKGIDLVEEYLYETDYNSRANHCQFE